MKIKILRDFDIRKAGAVHDVKVVGLTPKQVIKEGYRNLLRLSQICDSIKDVNPDDMLMIVESVSHSRQAIMDANKANEVEAIEFQDDGSYVIIGEEGNLFEIIEK